MLNKSNIPSNSILNNKSYNDILSSLFDVEAKVTLLLFSHYSPCGSHDYACLYDLVCELQTALNLINKELKNYEETY